MTSNIYQPYKLPQGLMDEGNCYWLVWWSQPPIPLLEMYFIRLGAQISTEWEWFMHLVYLRKLNKDNILVNKVKIGNNLQIFIIKISVHLMRVYWVWERFAQAFSYHQEKNVRTNSFARWRIGDEGLFYKCIWPFTSQ